MDALVVTVENEILKVSYDRSHYELIEEAVGGNFEVVRPRLLQRPYCMMVNEDGLLYGFPRNFLGCYFYGTQHHGVPIVGNIFIAKEGCFGDGVDLIGMSSEESQFLGDQFVEITGGVVRWSKK